MKIFYPMTFVTNTFCRDNVTLFYENTHKMSADIYIKSFKDLPSWKHALKLINLFEPEDLLPKNLMECCDKRNELANVPSENVDACLSSKPFVCPTKPSPRAVGHSGSMCCRLPAVRVTT